MMAKVKKEFDIDWIMLASLAPLLSAGLFTMYSFTGGDQFFFKQIIWIIISLLVFFGLSRMDFHFLRRTEIVVTFYLFSLSILFLLFILGRTVNGAKSWFHLGFFSFEPADLAKIALILLLAKYFSKRHVEIANIRHILVSGLYAFLLFFLVLLQPDLGAALIIFAIWFGIALVSGISKKHLLAVFLIGALVSGLAWHYGLKEYQKQRIITFVNPLGDTMGAGYNAYQSTIAVGSGGILGKGIGYGTQSRLNFLPEYQTDFVFAAFAEEWGFVGILFLFISFSILIFRILYNAARGESNFEILFGIGIAVFLIAHFTINVGMNIGLLPVTGIPLPFVSYGGSHMIILFASLGVLMGMRKYRRAAHKDLIKNEFLGI